MDKKMGFPGKKTAFHQLLIGDRHCTNSTFTPSEALHNEYRQLADACSSSFSCLSVHSQKIKRLGSSLNSNPLTSGGVNWGTVSTMIQLMISPTVNTSDRQSEMLVSNRIVKKQQGISRIITIQT